mmetsp:Transcript_59641/g.146222  ORF Transcript_59641/g.146222 Transcript_59641/m.146222 type:complete len:85 (+) Transcript_59641:4635-4889(+)
MFDEDFVEMMPQGWDDPVVGTGSAAAVLAATIAVVLSHIHCEREDTFRQRRWHVYRVLLLAGVAVKLSGWCDADAVSGRKESED